MDYKATLHLPKTDFPMKANLAQREVETLEFWEKKDVYHQCVKRNEKAPRFTLHDGPPYANGHIHLGTAMNKILKDMVVKYQSMKGSLAEYIPGWDCHGLPIELKVVKELGKKRATMSAVEFRQACRKYAERFLNVQREEFKRLGVLGEWADPYQTMNPAYQAEIVREFARVVEEGFVFRKKKPVLWCHSCETALAEAEVEYQDHTSHSIYVAFPLRDAGNHKQLNQFSNLSALIWTTTPWTLMANLAICLNRDFEYAVVRWKNGHYLLAKELVGTVTQQLNMEGAKTVETIPADELQDVVFSHPYLDRPSPILFGDHVTLEAGTGCVHTAPGHGQEDYEVGLANGLDIYTPVDGRGRFTKEVDHFAGQHVFKSNDAIIDLLKEKGALLGSATIDHSYPHCWRCKEPVIFRATEQWFIGIETNHLRQKSLEAVAAVEWVPKWGQDRIDGMLRTRPDWCISRQRSWGVPIVAFACRDCGTFFLDPKVIRDIADRMEQHPGGADLWYETVGQDKRDPLLPKGMTCEACGSTHFARGSDILDVWFDSGVSYSPVVEKRMGIQLPCELYLEGSDQHRGWFHSALLECLATRGKPPYKTVLTHGFVVDGEGRKMSKSLGNFINAEEQVKKRGAEILRLWVAAEDYQNDVRISEEILQRVTEAYRRIRNTCRFLLGNLNDFDANKNSVPYEKMEEMHRFLLFRLMKLTERCLNAYDRYAFHQVYHSIHNFCVVDLSSFYLDVSKDCLYTNAADSLERRSTQTVLFEVLSHLVRLLAPILSFTAEEIWQHFSGKTKDTPSIFLTSLPQIEKKWLDETLNANWEQLMKVRSEVLKVLEACRAEKVIGNSLEAEVKLSAQDTVDALLRKYESKLAELFIVSKVGLFEKAEPDWIESETVPGLRITAGPVAGKKCERCWIMKQDIGNDADHPTICERCVKALQK